MFIVAGLNTNHSIFESSKDKSSSSEIIYPPAECFKKHSFPTLASSISFYFDHSVFIEKNGQISVLGNNNEGQLGPYFHKSIYSTLSYSNFSRNTKFLSAVVGSSYTLFLLSVDQNKNDLFAYISWAPSAADENDQTHNMPINLEANGKPTIPVALFGGSEKAAIIDVDGNVFTITKEPNRTITSPIIAIPDTKIKVTRLKFANTTSFFSEKAICVACCNNFTLVLTKSGKVYGNGKINQENGRHVSDNDKSKGMNDRNILIEIDELKSHNIVQISGTFQHGLAVSSEGRVFGVGSNYNGQLGLGPNIKSTWQFTEIENIYPKYRIINTSSGSGHSIMISSEGQVLTFGNNGYHQLFQRENDQHINFYPHEVEPEKLKGRATFSIAGNCISGIFVNTEPPPNQPNTPLKSNRPYIMPDDSVSEAYEMQKAVIGEMQSEVDKFKLCQCNLQSIEDRSASTQQQLKNLIKCNHDEIADLKKKLEFQKKLFESLKNQNQELSRKAQILRHNEEIEQVLVESCIDGKSDKVHFIEPNLIDSFKKLEMIDENEFSQTFKIESKKSYTLKILKLNLNDDDETNKEKLKRLFIEYEVLSRLNHPNIVKTVGFMKGDSKMSSGIIQEYLITENITENYHKYEHHQETSTIESYLTHILNTILASVKYAHEEGIHYCHLNPSNIKFSKEHNDIKLLLQPLQQNDDKYDVFQAPEIKKEGKSDNDKSDVYSIGVFIYYLLYSIEHENCTSDEIGDDFCLEKLRNSDIEKVSSRLNGIIREMSEEELEKRPTITEVELKLTI